MGSCGELFGNSTSHRKSELFCGELVRIFCQLVTICTDKEWMRIEIVNFAANNLKWEHTCCGSVHLLAMFGPCLVGKCRNATTKWANFSSSTEG